MAGSDYTLLNEMDGWMDGFGEPHDSSSSSQSLTLLFHLLIGPERDRMKMRWMFGLP